MERQNKTSFIETDAEGYTTGASASATLDRDLDETLTTESLLENLDIKSKESQCSSPAGLSVSSVDTVVEAQLLDQPDTEMDPEEGTSGEGYQTAHAVDVTPQSKPPETSSAGQSLPKRTSGAARRQRKRRRMAAEGSTEGAWSSTSTSPAEVPAKKAKNTGATPPVNKPPLKYTEVVAKSLQVAIIFKDNPTRKLTEEEGKHVRKELVRLIDMFPSQSEAQRHYYYMFNSLQPQKYI